MKKRKSFVHTFVIRQRPILLLGAIAAFAAVFFGVGILNNTEDKNYSALLKAGIAHTLKNDTQLMDIKLPKISAYTFLGEVSPVFLQSAEPSANAENKESADAPQKTPLNISEKTIVSHNLDIKNETTYDIDPSVMVNESRTYTATGDKPRVLIVHTHGCETYSDDDGTGLGEGGSYRTTDKTKNMIAVGNTMAEVFIKKGINVIHDTTLCDYPKYNSSYVKALEVIEGYLEKYPSIEFVFDIHRDAIEAQDGTPTKLKCTIDGKSTAQAMIVCGTDAMGLENPNWRENLILAFKIQQKLESTCPTLMRPVNIRNERFNMHKTKGSLLFEVGTHGNTIEEAIRGAEHLADGIAAVIAE